MHVSSFDVTWKRRAEPVSAQSAEAPRTQVSIECQTEAPKPVLAPKSVELEAAAPAPAPLKNSPSSCPPRLLPDWVLLASIGVAAVMLLWAAASAWSAARVHNLHSMILYELVRNGAARGGADLGFETLARGLKAL